MITIFRLRRRHLATVTVGGYPMGTMPKTAAPQKPVPDSSEGLNTQEFARNMLAVGMKSQQLLLDFAARAGKRDKGAALDPLNISGAMLALAKAMSGDREHVMEAQAQWWNGVVSLWESTALRMLGGEAEPVIEPAKGDRRF